MPVDLMAPFDRERGAQLVFSACLVLCGCGSAIDRGAKDDLDRRLALLRTSTNSFERPAEAGPLPLRAGQWVQYRVVDEQGRPSLVTHKIVGEQSGALWIEVVTDSYAGREIVKMLVAFGV